MKSGRLLLLLIVLLAAPSMSIFPTAHATPAAPLKAFHGTLNPGEGTQVLWQVTSEIPEPGFLFHYVITGGSDVNDVAYVFIEETGDGWDYLMGEGWTYCSQYGPPPCGVEAEVYTVDIDADASATGPITFDIAFYLPAQPPIDFSGHIPPESDVRVSSFGILLSSASTGQLVLAATSGSYEFFIDGESAAVVTSTTELTVDFTAGVHQLEVVAEVQGVGEDVRWSVRAPPKLEIVILDQCPTLDPESGQSVCVTRAEAIASDGSSPAVSYLWTATGGSFNSTTSQAVEWTAPSGVATHTLTVQASAPGYFSGTKSIPVQVVPEFPPGAVPFLVALALATVLLTRRSRRHPAARAQKLSAND